MLGIMVALAALAGRTALPAAFGIPYARAADDGTYIVSPREEVQQRRKMRRWARTWNFDCACFRVGED